MTVVHTVMYRCTVYIGEHIGPGDCIECTEYASSAEHFIKWLVGLFQLLAGKHV